MINSSSRPLGLLFLLFLFHSISGQEFQKGWILSHQGDTLRGWLNTSSNIDAYRKCMFKPTLEAELISFFPNQLQSYYVPTLGYFESLDMDGYEAEGERFFASYLIKGRISLLRIEDQFFIENKAGEFIEISPLPNKSNEWEHSIPNKHPKENLRIAMQDCPEAVQMIHISLALTETFLTNLLRKYHKCRGYAFQDFKDKLPWVKLRMGIQGGVQFSTIGLAAGGDEEVFLEENDGSEHDWAPTMGIQWELSSPRLSHELALTVGLLYAKTAFKSTNQLIGSNRIENLDASYSFSTLSFPIGLRYYFNLADLPAYADLGILFQHILEFESSFNLMVETTGIIDPTPDIKFISYAAIADIRNIYGGWAGLGITLPYKGPGRLNLGIRAERNRMTLEEFNRRVTKISQVLYPRTINLKVMLGWDIDL